MFVICSSLGGMHGILYVESYIVCKYITTHVGIDRCRVGHYERETGLGSQEGGLGSWEGGRVEKTDSLHASVLIFRTHFNMFEVSVQEKCYRLCFLPFLHSYYHGRILFTMHS